MTRVLLVVEEPGLLDALCVALHAQGFEVAVSAIAGTGAAADPVDPGRVTTQVAELRPDLAVLDLGIAGLDGNRGIGELRGSTHLPIVALSGEDTNRGQVAALEAGADHFVTRPFTAEELIAHVRAILRRVGSALPAVQVEGRSADLVTFTRPNGEPVTLPPLALGTAIDKVPGVERFQLVVHEGQMVRLRLRIADGQDTEHVREAANTALRGMLEGRGLDNITVESDPTPPAREPGGGKFRTVYTER